MERILTAVLLCIGVAVYAQVPGLGPCFDAKPQSTLNVSQYLGHWYEITKLPSFFEIEQVCLTANYSVKEDGHIKVFNQGKVNGKNVSSTGDAYVPDPSEPSKLIVKFPQAAPYGPYWVLDTDYTSYSLVFSCEQLGSFAHAKFLWILSRTPSIDPAVKDRLFKRLEKDGIGASGLRATKRSDCS
ncbi:hypothetical protein LOTGIDRAFT_134336 [Lottia gigantea]|uniref:Apolipoprotein D n=1 Tax=Lottia gigantea TaxID=225164 RepID=V3YXY2_LOTGI|nr:hypothetical protein LOTGIDRAFT_134336 [Lottia gigantea]ESO82948.1 hypothetical protein LOTGIDRAFT_134336 [Lottia gigantea]